MHLTDDHPFIASANAMREIVAPLSTHNITYFTYNRNYLDGNRISLTTHELYLKEFYANQYYLSGNIDAKPNLYLNQAALFSTLPNQTLIQWAKNEFHVAHGVHIIRDNAEYTEFFTFASTPDHPEIVNFYLNHLDSIQQFCDYFLEQSQLLLIEVEKHKHILPYHDKGLIDYSPISEMQNYFKNDKKSPSISPREFDLIQPLMEGKTCKEIGKELNLSPRTVEFYLNRMRLKFKARNKQQLIFKLIQLFKMSEV